MSFQNKIRPGGTYGAKFLHYEDLSLQTECTYMYLANELLVWTLSLSTETNHDSL